MSRPHHKERSVTEAPAVPDVSVPAADAASGLDAPAEMARDVVSPAMPRVAGDLCVKSAHATPSQMNKEILHVFKHHSGLVSLPVVENGMPIGLINKSLFMTNFALPFHREVFERKSCIAFMDKTPLIVDVETPIQEIGRLVVEVGSKVLNDGFIITRQGRYIGTGTGVDLLQALGQLEEEKNRVVRESIEYASIIQHSLLRASHKELEAARLFDFHMLWRPRDVVGGDCYYAEVREADGERGVFVALMDCTGHGVPGALMSVMMSSFMDHALAVVSPRDPGGVLAKISQLVKASLDQYWTGDDSDSFAVAAGGERRADEGMDAMCLWINPDANSVIYAGAKLSMWIMGMKDKEPAEVAGDKMGIGYIRTPDDFVWTNRAFTVERGAALYFSTDGIFDQIGGKKRLAFGKKRLWQCIAENRKAALEVQLEKAYAELVDYQGKEQRRDDVSMFAARF
jgi:serine phosphatase RsbU (regulator of sigma subunit)